MTAAEHVTGGGDGGGRPGLWERFVGWAQRPGPGGQAPPSGGALPDTAEELEALSAHADDKERLIGLIAAPLAGMIAVIVTSSLIANDPKVGTKAHVDPSLYLAVGGVALALAAAMVGFAWFRKRLYLGITMALYGLSIFNLHFWGFGVPFVLGGAWYLVRGYRIQQKLKTVQAGGGGGGGGGSRGTPGASKRYTPPRGPGSGR